MTDLSIIVMVFVVSFVTCGFLALMFLAVDRSVDRHDQQTDKPTQLPKRGAAGQ